jgi:hypothetical protein
MLKKNQESLTRIHEDAFSECTNPKTHTHTLQNFGKICVSWFCKISILFCMKDKNIKQCTDF